MFYDSIPGFKSAGAIRMFFCKLMEAFPGDDVHGNILSQFEILSRKKYNANDKQGRINCVRVQIKKRLDQ
jgi:hypothetical protein